MSTGTFQFSFRQWDKEGGTAADIPVPPHQLLGGFPAQILLLRAVRCPWLRDKEVLGRSGGLQTLFPLCGEGVQGVWRGHKGGCWRGRACGAGAAGPACRAGVGVLCSPAPASAAGTLTPVQGRGHDQSWVPKLSHGSFPSIPPKPPLPHLSAPAQTLTGHVQPQHLPEAAPTAFEWPPPFPSVAGAGPGGLGGREGRGTATGTRRMRLLPLGQAQHWRNPPVQVKHRPRGGTSRVPW